LRCRIARGKDIEPIRAAQAEFYRYSASGLDDIHQRRVVDRLEEATEIVVGDDRPRVRGRGRIAITCRIGGFDGKGMATEREARVALRAGTATINITIQTALECTIGLRAAEAEAGPGSTDRVVRPALDDRIRWRPIDHPAVGGGSRTNIACWIDCPNQEMMTPSWQASVRCGAAAGSISSTVETTLERAAGLTTGKAEARTSTVRRVGWPGCKRCSGRPGIDDPTVRCRSGISVADRVHRADLEGVAAIRHSVVTGRAAAGCERSAIDTAGEVTADLAGMEGEAGTVAVGHGPRPGVNTGIRRCSIHTPRVRCRGWINVAGRIDGAYLEGMATVDKIGVAGWTGTGCEAAGIKLAGEGTAVLVRMEREARAPAPGQRARTTVDHRGGSGGVDRPAQARGRGVDVAGGVKSTNLERMAAIGETRVISRASTQGEGATIQLALEGTARLGTAKAEACVAIGAPLWWAGIDMSVGCQGIDRPAKGRG